jgi:hypothetical protein
MLRESSAAPRFGHTGRIIRRQRMIPEQGTDPMTSRQFALNALKCAGLMLAVGLVFY